LSQEMVVQITLLIHETSAPNALIEMTLHILTILLFAQLM